jgi:hypothetical protein
MEKEQGFKYTAAYAAGFIRYGSAVFQLVISRVQIGNFQPLMNPGSITQHAPDHTSKWSIDRGGIDLRQRFTFFHDAAYIPHHGYGSFTRRIEDTLLAEPFNRAWDTGVGQGAAGQEHSAEIVAPRCFDYDMHVLSRNETGTKGNGDFGHGYAGSAISFGKNGIDQGDRLQMGKRLRVRIDQDRDIPTAQDLFAPGNGCNTLGSNPFDGLTPIVYGFGKRHRPANCSRRFCLQDNHPETATVQAAYGAGGDISASADNDQLS